MKKTTLLTVTFVAILFTSSCQKDLEKDPLPSDGGKGTMTAKNGTLSPGEIHNLVLSEYLDAHGLIPDQQITVNEAYSEMLAISQIFESHGYLENRTAEEMADAVLSHQTASGYFADGVSKPTEVINDIIIQKVENQAIKTALIQISALADQGDPDFESNSQQILSQLNSLTSMEQSMMNGFGSVLDHSLVLWDAKLSPSEKAHKLKVAVADAIGYVDGFLWAAEYYNWDPAYIKYVLAEARDTAAYASARAAKS